MKSRKQKTIEYLTKLASYHYNEALFHKSDEEKYVKHMEKSEQYFECVRLLRIERI